MTLNSKNLIKDAPSRALLSGAKSDVRENQSMKNATKKKAVPAKKKVAAKKK